MMKSPVCSSYIAAFNKKYMAFVIILLISMHAAHAGMSVNVCAWGPHAGMCVRTHVEVFVHIGGNEGTHARTYARILTEE